MPAEALGDAAVRALSDDVLDLVLLLDCLLHSVVHAELVLHILVYGSARPVRPAASRNRSLRGHRLKDLLGGQGEVLFRLG